MTRTMVWILGMTRRSIIWLVVSSLTAFNVSETRAQCPLEWLPGDGVLALDGPVWALTDYDDGTGTALYAGGLFFIGGDVLASNIAKWDGAQWHAMGTGTSGRVLALAVYNNELIAAGEFISAGGQPANNIARWNGSVWVPLGSGMNWIVRALTVHNNELIAGGEFSAADGEPVNHIARWNGSNWAPLGAGTHSPVRALTIYNDELIAETQSNGSVFRWNGSNWALLGGGVGDTGHDVVSSLAVCNNELIVGGGFVYAGGLGGPLVLCIARWNGSAWASLGNIGIYGAVYSLKCFDGELIAGGDFTSADGQPANHIARWNGSAWAPLGSGMGGPEHANVFALSVHNNELIAGGDFTIAGGNASAYLARWGPACPGDLNCDGSVNELDIGPFALALADPDSHHAQFPLCPISRADMNNDGMKDGRDVAHFVYLLIP